MSERRSKEYYQALEEQLSALLPGLQRAVSTESWRWFEEWVRAGEYGLAGEVAAEGLLASARPSLDLWREVLAAADEMGLNSEPIAQLRDRLSAAS